MANPTYLEDYLVFPYPPLMGLNETLETFSQVLESIDSSEQRIAPRPTPRQGFNFSIFLNKVDEQAKLENMLFGWQSLYWGLPIWCDKVLHTGTLSSGSSSIDIDSSYADFRNNTLAIIWKSIIEYEVVLISDIDSSGLNLSETIVNTYVGDKWIMPCRLAQISSIEKQQLKSTIESVHTFTFLVVDNLLLTGYTPSVTYEDAEVITSPGLIEDGEEITSDALIRSQDYIVGEFEYFSFSDFNKVTRPYKKRLTSREDCWNYRLWIHSLSGRQNAIWYPTFKPDMRHVVTIGASDTEIEIANIGLTNNMGLNSLRTHLAFLLPNGTQLYRRIEDINLSNGNEVVTIDSALEQEIAVGGCTISFLDKCRSASDRFSFNWIDSDELENKINFIVVKE